MGKIVKMGERSPSVGELGRDGSRRDSGRTGEHHRILMRQDHRSRAIGLTVASRYGKTGLRVATMTGSSQLSVACRTTTYQPVYVVLCMYV